MRQFLWSLHSFGANWRTNGEVAAVRQLRQSPYLKGGIGDKELARTLPSPRGIGAQLAQMAQSTPTQWDGQAYELIAREPYERSDGSPAWKLVWWSHCATCGQRFACTTLNTLHQPNRRCAACKAPGRSVKRERISQEATHG